jgi:hypothetical protein
VRARADDARAHRLPRPAGARRRRSDERHHGRHRPPVGRPGRPRSRRQRHRGRPARARPGRRPAARRPGHRRRRLALDLLHQRAGRRDRIRGDGAVPTAAQARPAGEPRAAERRPARRRRRRAACSLPVGRPPVLLDLGADPRVRGTLPGGRRGILLAAATRPRAVLPHPAAAPPDAAGGHPAAAHDRTGDGRRHHLPDARPSAGARLDRGPDRPAAAPGRGRARPRVTARPADRQVRPADEGIDRRRLGRVRPGARWFRAVLAGGADHRALRDHGGLRNRYRPRARQRDAAGVRLG